MLTCKEAMELLSSYVAGRLDAEQAGSVRAHLKTCSTCPRVVNMCGVLVIQERTPRKTRRAAGDSAA
jgi:anti-sigma factor RsiW